MTIQRATRQRDAIKSVIQTAKRPLSPQEVLEGARTAVRALGMATVYRAKDLKHERTVAIKVLREELSVSLGADRFLREIRVAANLQHPNILGLYDSGLMPAGSSLPILVVWCKHSIAAAGFFKSCGTSR